MPELSPAAQAVLNAANGACSYGPDDVLNDSRQIAAAALRAASAQIPPLRYAADYIEHLLAIAAELEGQALLPQPNPSQTYD